MVIVFGEEVSNHVVHVLQRRSLMEGEDGKNSIYKIKFFLKASKMYY